MPVPISIVLDAADPVAGAEPVRSAVERLARSLDVRGLVYGVLELADRVEHADDVTAAFRLEQPVSGRPANAVRRVMRLFSSEGADEPWFHDEGSRPRTSRS